MTNFTKAILDTRTMAKRNLLKSFSNSDRLIENIIAPVMTMLIFVFVLGGAVGGTTGEISYVNYVVPGVILLCIGQCSTSTAVSISIDIEKGIIDRFRSMPIAKSSVLTGHVLEAVLRTILTTVLIIGVAFLIGFRPSAGIVEWLIIAALLLLFCLAITWVAIVYGLVVKGAEGANSFTMFIMLFTYLSSGFIPTDTLPAVLQAFAENQPMSPIINSIRGLLLNNELQNNLVLAFIWCLALLVIGYTVAMQLYKKKLVK